jgi:hypothetical protein
MKDLKGLCFAGGAYLEFILVFNPSYYLYKSNSGGGKNERKDSRNTCLDNRNCHGNFERCSFSFGKVRNNIMLDTEQLIAHIMFMIFKGVPFNLEEDWTKFVPLNEPLCLEYYMDTPDGVHFHTKYYDTGDEYEEIRLHDEGKEWLTLQDDEYIFEMWTDEIQTKTVYHFFIPTFVWKKNKIHNPHSFHGFYWKLILERFDTIMPVLYADYENYVKGIDE